MNTTWFDTGAGLEKSPLAMAGLEAFRTFLIRLGGMLLVFSFIVFPFADELLHWFQQQTSTPLATFGVADVFFALIVISLCLATAIIFPYIAYEGLKATATCFPDLTRSTQWAFIFFSILLFYIGVWFCVRITLPFGCRFLLAYETEHIQAMISVRKFVSFCMTFTVGFGILFELPLIMTLIARVQIIKADTMASTRKYAFLLIITLSAIITPTSDIFNLFLLAVPLYLLFEAGIIGMRVCEKKMHTQERKEKYQIG